MKSIDISLISNTHQIATMKAIVILFLSALLCGTLAEPLRYRGAQQTAQAKSVSNKGSGDEDTESNDEDPQQVVTEPTIYLSAPAPYPPTQWLQIAGLTNGQLLVLPVAVRENSESTSSNDSDNTEETSTTESQAANGQVQEVETSEPKSKPSAAHKRPGPTIIIIKGKKVGELKVQANQGAKQESAETSENTTETTEETVDAENSNEAEKKQTTNGNAQVLAGAQPGYFVQLPDGSYQQIVYFAPQTAFAAQPTNVPFQQLNQQASFNPFGYNPIVNPKIVTFSTQYNAK